MLQFDGVTKKYGGRVAVHDLTLNVAQGEIFAFIGPNGAGKSTTIKMLVGLLKPDAGAVSVEGFDTVRTPVDAKARVGYVPDEPYIHPKMTGREVLELSCRLWRVPARTIDARVEERLGQFGLRDAGDSLAESYSHGMLQKLSIASALIHEPALLVLDEPMVGLDPRAARLVKDLLRQHCEEGNTVFFSTHVLDVAERLCSRVGIIASGRLVAVGSMDELRDRAGGERSLEDVFLALTEEEQGAGSRL